MNFSLSSGLGGSDDSRSVLAHRDHGSRSDLRRVITGRVVIDQVVVVELVPVELVDVGVRHQAASPPACCEFSQTMHSDSRYLV